MRVMITLVVAAVPILSWLINLRSIQEAR